MDGWKGTRFPVGLGIEDWRLGVDVGMEMQKESKECGLGGVLVLG